MRKPSQNRFIRTASSLLGVLGCVMLLPVSGVILFGMHPKDTEETPDYLIVLGARVRGEEPGEALTNRISAAHAYLSVHPNTTAVLSGGVHAGESLSEAECMRQILRKRGIPEDRLILEAESKTTAENLKNSFRLIPSGKTVGVLTGDYHMLRSVGIAKRMGYTVSRHAVKTEKDLSFSLSLFREDLAVIKAFFKRQI